MIRDCFLLALIWQFRIADFNELTLAPARQSNGILQQFILRYNYFETLSMKRPIWTYLCLVRMLNAMNMSI